jgi:hypothetical protein
MIKFWIFNICWRLKLNSYLPTLWVSSYYLLNTISWNVESGITNLNSLNLLCSWYIFFVEIRRYRGIHIQVQRRIPKERLWFATRLCEVFYTRYIFPHALEHWILPFFRTASTIAKYLFFSKMCWKYCGSRILLFLDYMYFGIYVHINNENIFSYISPELKYY